MTLPRYKDIVDLIKQGNTAEAQKHILAVGQAVTLREPFVFSQDRPQANRFYFFGPLADSAVADFPQ